jgi:ABC-type amino acid transport substrate-binding protein
MQNVYFWNGNKSPARQNYELALLEACLYVTNQEYGSVNVRVNNTDYPNADDEGNIFASGVDILVTVAGNVKFQDKQKLVITQPLTKGLLGYRLLLVRDESLASFAQISKPQQLQALSIGIPQTWADAELFRHNQYKVVEKGTLDDLFSLLKKGTFDYVALGVNEIEEIFTQREVATLGISIEPSLMLYYDFPLVFYVTSTKPSLAQRVKDGLNKIVTNGEFEVLFEQYHGDVVKRLNLREREVFTLHNPALPAEMYHFSGSLLD